MVNFLFVWNLLQWRPDCELLSIYTLFLLLNPLSLIFFLHYHFVYFINSAVQFYSEKNYFSMQKQKKKKIYAEAEPGGIL